VDPGPADQGIPVVPGTTAAAVDSVPVGSGQPARDGATDPDLTATSGTPAEESPATTAARIVPPPTSRETSTNPTSAPVAGFYLHIYSFRTPERADSMVRRWDNPEDSISIHQQEVRGVDWYRVYLGPYPTREAALMVALRLKQDGTIGYYKVIDNP
jgi:septal ring-binding cell division protein DamX